MYAGFWERDRYLLVYLCMCELLNKEVHKKVSQNVPIICLPQGTPISWTALTSAIAECWIKIIAAARKLPPGPVG